MGVLFKLLRYVFFSKKRTTYAYREDKDFNNARKNKQKGDKYELQIGKSYQKQGYKVYFKGINEGLRDKGIDIIAYKKLSPISLKYRKIKGIMECCI